MSLFKSLSIYTLTSIINAGIPFLLLPILTGYLSPSEYGILSIIQIFIVLTVPFVSINIANTVQLEYYHLNKDEFSKLVSSILTIPIAAVVIVTILFLVFESTLRLFLNISLFWLLFIPLIALMQILPQIILSIYQISEKPINYGKYQIGLAILNFLLSILLVVIYKYGWEGRIIAIFLSYIFFSGLALYLLFKMNLITLEIEKKYIEEVLKVGLPLILHVVSAALFMMSDRLFISYYLGNSEVGIYSVGVQVAMMVLIIQQAFNQAWIPYLFKNLKTNLYENKIKIVKLSYLAFGFFLILPFIVDLLSYPIFSLFIDEKFIESQQFVFWIALGYSFMGMYKVVTNYIFYEKKTQLLAIVTFTSLVVNFIFNYFFINIYGAIGVAYATALTLFLFFILTFVLAHRIHPMPWLLTRKN